MSLLLFVIGVAAAAAAAATPQLYAHSHHGVLIDDGRIVTWGRNTGGEIDRDAPTPMRDTLMENAVGAARGGCAGRRQTCAFGDNGLWCRGNDEPLRALNVRDDVVEVVCGWTHVCARYRSTPSAVTCYGANNEYNQLGAADRALTGEYTHDFGVPIAALSRGALGNSTCAALGAPQHEITCWGANTRGQLTISGSYATQAPILYPLNVTDLPHIEVVALYGGYEFFCALYSVYSDGAGGVKCWGDNTYNQLGWTDSAYIPYIGHPFRPSTDAPILRPENTTIASMFTGPYVACYVTTYPEAFRCMGRNRYGEAGAATPRLTQLYPLSSALPITLPPPVRQIFGGAISLTAAVLWTDATLDGAMITYGSNADYMLAIGDTDTTQQHWGAANATVAATVVTPPAPTVANVTSGVTLQTPTTAVAFDDRSPSYTVHHVLSRGEPSCYSRTNFSLYFAYAMEVDSVSGRAVAVVPYPYDGYNVTRTDTAVVFEHVFASKGARFVHTNVIGANADDGMKLSIDVEGWRFVSPNNRLVIGMGIAGVHPSALAMRTDDAGATEFTYTRSGVTLMSSFAHDVVVDGTPVLNGVSIGVGARFAGSSGDAIIGVSLPWFSARLSYDPNFSTLVGTSSSAAPTDDVTYACRNGSLVTATTTTVVTGDGTIDGATLGIIIGAALGGVVLMTLLVVVVTRRKRIFWRLRTPSSGSGGSVRTDAALKFGVTPTAIGAGNRTSLQRTYPVAAVDVIHGV